MLQQLQHEKLAMQNGIRQKSKAPAVVLVKQ
jgi:hypothetical protein